MSGSNAAQVFFSFRQGGVIMGYVIAIIIFVLIGNAVMLFFRHRNARRETEELRSNRKSSSSDYEELVRRNEQAQEHAFRRVQLRNKTLEMYDQVRKRGDAADQEAAAAEAAAAEAAADATVAAAADPASAGSGVEADDSEPEKTKGIS